MIKILLVDDMKHFLNLERSFLKRAESQLLTATTGLEAVKVAREAKPDIILLDVEMPEMNGIEATRILKSLDETRDIPIVIITSLNVEEEAAKAGAEGYQQKPVDEDTFLSLIRRYVDLPIRTEPRLDTSISAYFVLREQRWPGKITDLSTHGCFFEGGFKPPIGELITIDFPLALEEQDKQIRQEAYIVRVMDSGIGCSFHDISTGTEIYLKEYIHSLTGSDE